MTIKLNSQTDMHYGKVIKLYERSPIEERDGVYFIDGKKATSYTFKQDYYFMMGDNRKGTIDSRSWGFLPEEI